METPKTPIPKAILTKKRKAQGIFLHDFKPYYKVMLIGKVQYW